ncbi:substrate-binding domain-containing protein [Spirochaeta dissipatitropha]
MRITKTGCALILLVVLISGNSCTDDAEAPIADVEHKSIRIGFSLDSLVVERWARDRDEFFTAAGEYEAQVVLRNANEDLEAQRRQLLELSRQNIDVLVIIPNDSEALSDTVQQIRNQGIPVLAYDRVIRNVPIDAYVSYDLHLTGRIMAESIVAALLENDTGVNEAEDTNHVPRLLIINGALNDYNSFVINQGIISALRQALQNGEIELLESMWLQRWRNEEARDAILQAFERYERIDAVIAANDLIADAVVREAAGYGLAGTILVSGMDGDLSAVQRIAEGTQLMTMYKPISPLAREAVAAAVRLARGEDPGTEERFFNGSHEIPFIKLKPVLVTRDTIMDTVVADGFHDFADVYRNVSPEHRPR